MNDTYGADLKHSSISPASVLFVEAISGTPQFDQTEKVRASIFIFALWFRSKPGFRYVSLHSKDKFL